MPIVTQIVCDGCRATKKESGDWYTLTTREHTAEMTPLQFRSDGRPCAERDGLQQYFCGRYCVIEALTKWMDGLKLSGAPAGPHQITVGIRGQAPTPARHDDAADLSRKPVGKI